MEPVVVPSILASTQAELEERIARVAPYAERLQLDVVDGEFADSHSLDFDFTLPAVSSHREAHFMVANPASWIDLLAPAADTLLPHIEATPDPTQLLTHMKGTGKRVGFAVAPGADVERIKPLLAELDQVLVVTVDPGYYGSAFLPEMLDAVREIAEAAPQLPIEVDGGIDDTTIREARSAGASLFVSGSYIMEAEDPKEAIANLYAALQ